MSRPPHAPWRAGPPRFAVGLKPIDPAAWLTPDTEAHVLQQKRSILARPELCFRQSHKANAAQHEAARLVASAVGEPLGEGPPLLAAAALVSDDLVVMEADENGDWRATSIVLTAPTFFTIDRAFDAGLEALHGPVPDGERLARRIGRVFDNLPDDAVLERFNWTLQAGGERFTPDAAPLRDRARAAPSEMAADLLHVRVERQTIRRLPDTDAVLFTIRVCLDPVTAIAEEDRAVLAKAWRGISEDGRAYKGWDALDHLAQAQFAAWGV
ncbi:heme-dependent oxidative N-demethylase subunit alpha family protein [Marinicauda salina]|uniref:heme-dependent oxidative N-demethylase subunit alpha family protein n=1 Tax=Marinicauda salina TaxID=2135793 RepID=UPI000D647736|nr:heme-dependent oxidative N-demethylase subunit alpha family protein [Marinicauda salina]